MEKEDKPEMRVEEKFFSVLIAIVIMTVLVISLIRTGETAVPKDQINPSTAILIETDKR